VYSVGVCAIELWLQLVLWERSVLLM
jgi:hypothetical protein